MDFNRMTEKVQQALQAAQSKAVRLHNQQIDVEHLLAALLEQENGVALSILLKAGLENPEILHRRLEEELEKRPKVSSPSGAPDQIYVTGRLNTLLTHAEDEAKRLKDEYTSVEHLLLAMTNDSVNGFTARVLKELGITRDRLMKGMQDPARDQPKSRSHVRIA